MAKQTKTRRAARAAKVRIDAREWWLAGLGAVSLTRKRGIELYGTLLEEGKQFQGRAGEQIDTLQRQARDGFQSAKSRVESAIAPLRERTQATYGQVKSEVETRLRPMLVRFGVKPAAKARTRKAATTRGSRKPAAKRGATKKAA